MMTNRSTDNLLTKLCNAIATSPRGTAIGDQQTTSLNVVIGGGGGGEKGAGAGHVQQQQQQHYSRSSIVMTRNENAAAPTADTKVPVQDCRFQNRRDVGPPDLSKTAAAAQNKDTIATTASSHQQQFGEQIKEKVMDDDDNKEAQEIMKIHCPSSSSHVFAAATALEVHDCVITMGSTPTTAGSTQPTTFSSSAPKPTTAAAALENVNIHNDDANNDDLHSEAIAGDMWEKSGAAAATAAAAAAPVNADEEGSFNGGWDFDDSTWASGLTHDDEHLESSSHSINNGGGKSSPPYVSVIDGTPTDFAKRGRHHALQRLHQQQQYRSGQSTTGISTISSHSHAAAGGGGGNNVYDRLYQDAHKRKVRLEQKRLQFRNQDDAEEMSVSVRSFRSGVASHSLPPRSSNTMSTPARRRQRGGAVAAVATPKSAAAARTTTTTPKSATSSPNRGNAASSATPFGNDTASGSVFERLYRNEQCCLRKQHRTLPHGWPSPSASLDRRLHYVAPKPLLSPICSTPPPAYKNRGVAGTPPWSSTASLGGGRGCRGMAPRSSRFGFSSSAATATAAAASTSNRSQNSTRSSPPALRQTVSLDADLSTFYPSITTPASPARSTATTSEKKESVFERLYQNKPRPESLLPSFYAKGSSSSISVSSQESRRRKSLLSSYSAKGSSSVSSQRHRRSNNDSNMTPRRLAGTSKISSPCTASRSVTSDRRRPQAFISCNVKTQQKVGKQTQSSSSSSPPNARESLTPAQCATRIQSNWRASRTRQIFVGKRQSAIVISNCWKQSQESSVKQQQLPVPQLLRFESMQREWLRMNASRTEMSAQPPTTALEVVAELDNDDSKRQERQLSTAAATCIQTRWRGSRARTIFVGYRHSAILIESRWRSYRDRQKYQQQQCDDNDDSESQMSRFLQIQQDWSSITASTSRSQTPCTEKANNCNGIHNTCALQVQTVWRVYSKKKPCAALLETTGAIKIQSLWRQQQQQLGKPPIAAILDEAVKSADQTWLSREGSTEGHVQNADRGVVLIQSYWRKSCRMAEYAVMRAALLLIQTCWRKTHSVNHYQMSQQAVATTQTWWRKVWIQGKYHTIRRKAILVQSSYRSYKAVQAYRARYTVALLMQPLVRGAQCRADCYNARQMVATLRVQTCWRQRKTMGDYRRLRAATLFTQSVIRGNQCRRNLKATAMAVVSATRIQTWWRQVHVLHKYRSFLSGLTLLQALIRGHHCRSNACELNNSVLLVQTSWRRCKALEKFHRLRVAAVMIQSVTRSHLCRTKLIAISLTSMAATRIQAWWRCCNSLQKYRSFRKSLVILQAAARGRQSRAKACEMKKVAAIVLVQSYWRQHYALENYRRLRAAAVLTQSVIRSYQCRDQLAAAAKTNRISAVRIQSAWRRHYVLSKYRRAHLAAAAMTNRISAVRIQSSWRRHFALYKFSQYQAFALLLQAVTRGHQCRSNAMKLLLSIRRVQTCWRRHQAFRLYHLQLSASVRLQASWRRRVAVDDYLQKKEAVIVLQGAIRRHQQMVIYCNFCRSASCIQYWWRRRRRMMVVQQATSRLQKFCRAAASRTLYQKSRVGAVLVQRFIRGRVARRKWTELRASCVMVQAVIRRRMVASHYHAMLHAIGLFQRLWRGFQCRLQVTRWTFAAVKIQSAMRRRLASRVRARMVQEQVTAFLGSHANTIQACIRRYSYSKQFKRKQAAVRVIKRAYVSWKMKLRLVKLQCAAILLHRRVRGQLSRCELFALRQANSCLRSKIVISFGLIVPNQSELHHAWKHAAFEVNRNAAIIIQRAYHSQRSESSLRHNRSAVIIQLALKRFLLDKRIQRRRACRLRRSPVSMTVVRQISPERLEVEFTPVDEEQAAQTLQSFWQQHPHPMHQAEFTTPRSLERPSIELEVVRQISRHRLEVNFCESQSALLEQMRGVETFRKEYACKKLQIWAGEMLKLKRQECAARILQTFVLTILVRKEQERSQLIESFRKQRACKKLQSWARESLMLKRQECAALVLQAAALTMRVRKEVPTEQKRERNCLMESFRTQQSCKKLQIWVCREMLKLKRQECAARILQTFAWNILVRKEQERQCLIETFRKKAACKMLQSWIRASLMFKRKERAVRILQTFAVTILVRKEQERERNCLIESFRKQRACKKLQVWFREALMPKRQECAALVLQAAALTMLVRKDVPTEEGRERSFLMESLRTQQSCKKLQIWVCREMLKLKRQERAARIIQTSVLAMLLRKEQERHCLIERACTKIQIWTRAMLKLKRQERAARILQTFAVTILLRKEQERELNCVMESFRMQRACKKLQVWVREILRRKRQERAARTLRKEEELNCFIESFRRQRACNKLQVWFREVLMPKRRECAARVLQAAALVMLVQKDVPTGQERNHLLDSLRTQQGCTTLQIWVCREMLKLKRQERAARIIQASVLAMLLRREQDRSRAIDSFRRKWAFRVLTQFVIFALEKSSQRRRVIDSFRRKIAARLLVKFFILALPKCRLRREQATCQFKQQAERQAETLVTKLLDETAGAQRHDLKLLESPETTTVTTTTTITTTAVGMATTTTTSCSLGRYVLRTQQARLEAEKATASLEQRRKALVDYKKKKKFATIAVTKPRDESLY